MTRGGARPGAGRPKGAIGPARPGVRYGPLTAIEIGTLRAFSEGMTTREIADAKKTNLRAVRRVLERLRLKLGVYTNLELMYKTGRDGTLE